MNLIFEHCEQPRKTPRKNAPKPRGPIEIKAKAGGILHETLGDADKIKSLLTLIRQYIDDAGTGVGLASEISPAIIDHYHLGCTKQQFSIFYKVLFQQGLLNKLPVKPLQYELTDKGVSLLPIIDAMSTFGHAWLIDEHDHEHVTRPRVGVRA